jgi:hypothetical protein
VATEESFEFGSNGQVTRAEAEKVPVLSAVVLRPMESDGDLDDKGLQVIEDMIADPNAQVADIMRLLALEMAKVVKKMVGKGDPLARGNRSQRDLNDMLKGLREMQKALTDSDALSKRDVLNFDGPKFQFVFSEITGLFQKALLGAGIDEEGSRNVMQQWRDLVAQNEEQMRRDLNKL